MRYECYFMKGSQLIRKIILTACDAEGAYMLAELFADNARREWDERFNYDRIDVIRHVEVLIP